MNISDFKDEQVVMNVNATGNNFLFFGDTYMYGETDYKLFKVHTGWKAFIDGNETKIYRANHAFRGIVVPAGKHKIEFIYAPESFEISKNIALILSSLSFAGLIIGLIIFRKEKNKIILRN